MPHRLTSPIRLATVLAVGLCLPALLAAPAGAVPDHTPEPAPFATEPVPDDDEQEPIRPVDPDRTTWSIEPSDGDAPDGRVSFRFDVAPGDTVADHVAVTNFGAHPATFALSAGDGVVTADGQFDIVDLDDESAGGPGSWVTFDGADTAGEPLTVEVGPESSVTVPFSIAVPADATPGDRPAGIVAALVREQGGSVGLDARVGARVHLRVLGDLEPILVVEDVRAEYLPSWNPLEPGQLRLSYTVANTGNVRLGAATVADGAAPLGWAARSAEGDPEREILPGAAAGGTVVLDDVWPLARVSGEVRTTGLVVGEDVLEVALPTAEVAFSAWTIPWPQIAVVLLVVGLVLALRSMRARRDRLVAARVEAAVAAARRDAGTQLTEAAS